MATVFSLIKVAFTADVSNLHLVHRLGVVMTSQNAENSALSALPALEHSSIQLTLAEKDRWKELAQFTNELIVTKAGRMLFPKLNFDVRGLDPKSFYTFSLFMKLVGSSRWKFVDGEWQSDGPSDISEASNVVMHHDCAQTGEYWMKHTVSFSRVKLTNRPLPQGSEISLSPMHKYQPVVHVTRWHYNAEDGTNRLELELAVEPSNTEFFAVTAYQNQQVIDLKISYNPFAKGFRESANRKRRASDELSPSENKRGAFALTIDENASEHLVEPLRKLDDANRGENPDSKWHSSLTVLRVFSFIIAVASLIAAILCLIFIERAFLCILGAVASLACLYAIFMRASPAYLSLVIQFLAMTFLAAVGSSLGVLMFAASQVETVKKTIQYVLTDIIQTTLTVEHFQTYCSLFSAGFCGIALIFFVFAVILYRAYRRQKESAADK